MEQDPSTIVVLKGQALIYSTTDNGILTYRYRLNNGTDDTLISAMLPYLGLVDADLPKVINSDVLLAGLDTNFATVANMTIALSRKADLDKTLSMLAIKASKQDVATLIAKVAYKDEMDLALSKKADLTEMEVAFDTKADRTNVYTIDQVHRVIMDFIGATCVENIAVRDSLDYGMYPFVWVRDASADLDPRVHSPALYKWIANTWYYLGTVGDFNTGSSGGLDVDTLNRISSIENRLTLLEEIVANIGGGSSCDCDERLGSGVTRTNTATAQFLAHDARLLSIETELGTANQTLNAILSAEFNVEG